nr:immunoglobulin light chain junction region [Macaca mulatta]
CQHSYDAPYSF